MHGLAERSGVSGQSLEERPQARGASELGAGDPKELERQLAAMTG